VITHHVGDVLDVVRSLPDDSVDFVATSPPFLDLRDYGGGLDGQWGREPNPAAFLDHMLELTVKLRRVLVPLGSIAIELGDTYVTRPRGGWPARKSLCLIPTLYPACLAYGRNLLDPGGREFEPWRVRNVIVWARNNPPVGGLGDKVRPATSYITVATPSAKRWFDLDAVRTESREGHAGVTAGGKYDPRSWNDSRRDGGVGHFGCDPAGAPPTDHWTDEPDEHLTWLVNSAGSSLAHFAMWPPKLAERLVLSMCPAEVCRGCGEPRRRITEKTERYADHRSRSTEAGTSMRSERVRLGMGHGGRGSERMDAELLTVGWSDCGHDSYRSGVVLDPFAGSGTTLAVADLHGRDAIGIDLDPANTALHEARAAEVKRALFGVDPPMPGQLKLLN
jgi:DNA modification methylase